MVFVAAVVVDFGPVVAVVDPVQVVDKVVVDNPDNYIGAEAALVEHYTVVHFVHYKPDYQTEDTLAVVLDSGM